MPSWGQAPGGCVGVRIKIWPASQTETRDQVNDLAGEPRPETQRHFKVFGQAPGVFLLALTYLLLLILFLALKWSYRSFDQEKYFRDSKSYAASADLPRTSLAFWAGERSFTLPLLYKFLGVGLQNYQTPLAMTRVSQVQVWLSIFSWVLLALAVARQVRRRWLGAVGFGLVLTFSLAYDISRWDLLLLSESLSFSLFVLMVAGWLWLVGLAPPRQRSIRGLVTLMGLILVTILYSFTRDSNLYFVLMGAVVFSAAVFLRRCTLPRIYILTYLASAVLLFFAQNASINTGNRWQVFIYDHLAYRIIPNPAALAYFVRAGLPVSDSLLNIPNMSGSKYQALLLDDPTMEPVRQWTNTHGKATYAGWLLSRPLVTLGQPLLHASSLLDGLREGTLYGRNNSVLNYRSRRNPGQPIGTTILGLSRILFPIFPVWVYAAGYLALTGLTGLALLRGWRQQGSWLVVAVLLVSLYPLMFLVWHGNPMEIERHALQVAIQFRLAAWLALLFCLDERLSRSGA